MVLRTGRANNHVHIYNLGSGVTSFDQGHRHSIMIGSTMTSINQGHNHSLMNMNEGIISITRR